MGRVKRVDKATGRQYEFEITPEMLREVRDNTDFSNDAVPLAPDHNTSGGGAPGYARRAYLDSEDAPTKLFADVLLNDAAMVDGVQEGGAWSRRSSGLARPAGGKWKLDHIAPLGVTAPALPELASVKPEQVVMLCADGGDFETFEYLLADEPAQEIAMANDVNAEILELKAQLAAKTEEAERLASQKSEIEAQLASVGDTGVTREEFASVQRRLRNAEVKEQLEGIVNLKTQPGIKARFYTVLCAAANGDEQVNLSVEGAEPQAVCLYDAILDLAKSIPAGVPLGAFRGYENSVPGDPENDHEGRYRDRIISQFAADKGISYTEAFLLTNGGTSNGR